jgi:hypothetical protein
MWVPFAEPAVDCRYDDKGTRMRAVPAIERNEIKCPQRPKRKLRISAPANGASVDREAATEVSPLETGLVEDDLPRTMWIVVHPMKNPAAQAYWVQPTLTRGATAAWQGDILLGEESRNWNEQFEIKAFGDPYVALPADLRFPSWPEAAWESDTIVLRRKPGPAPSATTNSDVTTISPAPSTCPTSVSLTAKRVAGENWADVIIEARPEVLGSRYWVRTAAPNGQVYLGEEQQEPRFRTRLGDAAAVGTFGLTAEVKGPRGCKRIRSGNSVSIKVQPQGEQ